MSMILYNMRHRGPFEYDKFTLNIFQLFNEVKILEAKLDKKEYGQFKKKVSELNGVFDELTGAKSITQEALLLRMQLE